MDAELACQIWRYEPETGYFFWLVSPRYDVEVGARAGSFDGKYWCLQYGGKIYKASRVAWLMTYGRWPELQVDHINGVKTDDRIDNLRQATNSENLRNRPATRENRLGIKGVTKTRYAFVAQINVHGKHRHIGSYRTPEEAKAAYDAAAVLLHGEFAQL